MIRFLLQELEDIAGIFLLFLIECWPIWILCVIGTILIVWLA